jgi:tripartite-type tricarboxylate transporter receptor subunit TctC
MRRRHLAALAVLLPAAPALAQPRWPARSVRLVVPFAPGGPSDVCARILSERMSAVWEQPVVVENRAGAGGNIGADLVAKAAPDGHTLLVPASSIIAAPFLVPSIPFDPMRDFAPVAEVVDYPMVVLAHPSVPAKDMRELVALARSKPDEVTYSSAGVGNTSHLARLIHRGSGFGWRMWRKLLAGFTDLGVETKPKPSQAVPHPPWTTIRPRRSAFQRLAARS